MNLYAERHDIRAVVSGVESGGDLLIASGGDQTYQGARLEAGGDLGLLSEGAIHFDTASDIRSEAHERSRSNFAWQSARGEGSTRETLRQSELVAQGEMIIQAAQGITIDVPEVNARSVRQVIDAMAEANPDLAWLQAMEARGDVDWRQVEAIHDSWNYSQSGLGPGAALAVSIVAAAWAGPTAAGLVNNAIGAAMVGAGAGSLAGTGAVGLINQRGDLGAALGDTLSSDSLRGAALAALSAGATQGMTDHVWGTQTNTTTGATTNLSLGEWGDIGRFAGQRATQAAIDAGLRAAMEGGSFQGHLGDSVESAIAHVVSGVLFHAVGDLAGIKDWAEGSPEKIALHALVGGSVAEAMGGDFRTGALAAGANEALIEQLADLVAKDSTWLVAASQVVGIVAAELTGGDVAIGAEVAGQATRYNYLSHQQLTTANEELAACEGDSACMAEVVDRYQALSQQQDDAGYAACVDDLVACQQHSLAANGGVYAAYSDGSLWDLSTEALPYMQALFDENIGVQNSFSEATIARLLAEGTEISPEVAAVLAAMPVGVNLKGRGHLSHVEGTYSLVGANAAVIDSRKFTEYALNLQHPVGRNKARVFESVLGFTRDNADDLMNQVRHGVMVNTPIPGKVDQFGERFTVDIPVTGPTGSGIVRTGWIYKTDSNVPEMTTIFVK